jgi:hypothetical protein
MKGGGRDHLLYEVRPEGSAALIYRYRVMYSVLLIV